MVHGSLLRGNEWPRRRPLRTVDRKVSCSLRTDAPDLESKDHARRIGGSRPSLLVAREMGTYASRAMNGSPFAALVLAAALAFSRSARAQTPLCASTDGAS